MPKRKTAAAKGSGPRRSTRSTRRVSTLEKEIAVMSMGSDEEGGAEGGPADATADSDEGERMVTRQVTNPGRRRTLQRLMEAIREGEFDSDASDSDGPKAKAAPAPRTRATRRSSRRSTRTRRAKPQSGSDGDSDYVHVAANDDNDDDDGVDAEDIDAADDLEQLKQTEKKLILKFKNAGRARISSSSGGGGASRASGEVRLDDIDWSEFDPETINQILARREALRKKRRKAKMATDTADGSGEATAAKLKKSSLAPPPLQLDKPRPATGGLREDGEYEFGDGRATAEEGIAAPGGFETMDMDNADHDYVDLFEDVDEAALQAPGSQLHLPPRALPVSTDGLAELDVAHEGPLRMGRPHPALIRNMMDRHLNADKDMRIVLQYELQQEEALFKDLQAEIMDKLLKLQAEERLLRLIVKKDFELPDDAHAEEAVAMDTAYAGLNDAELGVLHGALGTLQSMDVDEASGSESDSSLSGMSSGSGSSDDEVATRGALSRMLEGLEPNDGGNADSSDASSSS